MRKAFNDNTRADSAPPRWDLNTLYPGPKSRELAQDEARGEKLAHEFARAYEGKIAALDAAGLADAIAAYEKILEINERIVVYANLLEAEDTRNFAKTAGLRDWEEAIEDITFFFQDEIISLPEKQMQALLAEGALAHYAPWLRRTRREADADVEETGPDIDWERRHDEALAAIRVTDNGITITVDEAEAALSDPSLEVEERRYMRDLLSSALEQGSKRMARIYNGVVQENLRDAALLGHARADIKAHIEDDIATPVVDAMFDAAKKSYARVSHRYHAWLAAQHGVDAIDGALAIANLPRSGKSAAGDIDGPVTFGAVRALVQKAFHDFSPEMALLSQKIFNEKHVDGEVRAHKQPGGFTTSPGPGILPFVTFDYSGLAGDAAFVVAHEMGHAVHLALSEEACGLLLSRMSASVTEIPAVFAETLAFDALVAAAATPGAQREMRSQQTDNILRNFLWQISYYDFEKRAHEAGKTARLTANILGDIWLETQREYGGPSWQEDALDRYRWMTVSHFYGAPFYVYSYAFAQHVVCGLYQAYREAEAQSPLAREAFVEKYMTFLTGGTKEDIHDMLKPFGLDPSSPAFWENGTRFAEKCLDDLEASAPAGIKKPRPPRKSL